jgi:hypothetical protein
MMHARAWSPAWSQAECGNCTGALTRAPDLAALQAGYRRRRLQNDPNMKLQNEPNMKSLLFSNGLAPSAGRRNGVRLQDS